MARFLFVVIPAAGHVHPTIPLAQELVRRGHTVGYCTGPTFASTVEPEVDAFFPVGPPVGSTEIRRQWPELGTRRGLARTHYLIREIMFPAAEVMARETLAVLPRFAPDVLISDISTYAGPLVAELSQLPWATVSVVPGLLPTRDLPPYGTGLPYPPPFPLRLAAPVMRAVGRAIFRRHDRQFNAIYDTFGLPPRHDAFLTATTSPYLYLGLVPPEFEYPRRDWPPQAHLIGPSVWDRPRDYTPPRWLAELPGDRPLVYATIGTAQSVFRADFFAKLVEAFRGMDVTAVVTTGSEHEDLPHPPPNVHLATYIPNSLLLPKATVALNHGGLSSTLGT